jgi:ribonucleoside-diphosphate reductase alpha chain
MKLSKNSEYTLTQRYLIRNKDNEVIETPRKLFRRVAKSIAEVELQYGKTKQEVKILEREFFNMMTKLEFLPNSPTLMNAGTKLGQLSACFVLPIPDDIIGIFDAVKHAAMIHKSGGGTGFTFQNLRPKDDVVKSTCGTASGPLSFARVIDVATEVIKQGGKRRGANMGIQSCHHPDIAEFIISKEKEGVECPKCGWIVRNANTSALANFNLSVSCTDKFLEAVKNDDFYELINPRTGKVVRKEKARVTWNLLQTMSWKNGEPAVVFIDNMNRDNPTPTLGLFEATNPCGETPLLPYESCNLGSINLSSLFRKNKKNGDRIDWERLKKLTKLSVIFLDNVIDANHYPLPEIKEATLRTRKIGLGVMGWADLLIKLEIPYDSNEGVELAKKIMKFIRDEGIKTSEEIGATKGDFPAKSISIYADRPNMRNATITTIAPTGTISIIAGCSQSIEPLFAIITQRNVADSLGKNLKEVNPVVKELMQEKGYWNTSVEKALQGNQCIIIPQEIKEKVPTAHKVSPEWHVRMQAAFQKYTHNAVSKTVNLPEETDVDTIGKIYLMAHKLGCKGITVYRNGSRKYQLLESNDGACPSCD